jgi:hypothetical protein
MNRRNGHKRPLRPATALSANNHHSA